MGQDLRLQPFRSSADLPQGLSASMGARRSSEGRNSTCSRSNRNRDSCGDAPVSSPRHQKQAASISISELARRLTTRNWRLDPLIEPPCFAEAIFAEGPRRGEQSPWHGETHTPTNASSDAPRSRPCLWA